MIRSILARSAAESRPARSLKRRLLTVVSWSVIAFWPFPFSVIKASLGYRRSTFVESGTTWTRFRYLLAASLLIMTAGRCFWISPSTNGSKLTHQTSPRCISDVSYRGFNPFQCLGLTFLICSHGLIGGRKVCADDVGAHKLVSPKNYSRYPDVDAVFCAYRRLVQCLSIDIITRDEC